MELAYTDDNKRLILNFSDIESIDQEYTIDAINNTGTLFEIKEVYITGKDFMNIDNIKELHSFIKVLRSDFRNLVITVETKETFDKLATINNYFILDTLSNIDYLEDGKAKVDLRATKMNKKITYLENKSNEVSEKDIKKEETVEEKPKRKRGRPRKNTTSKENK